MSRVVDVVVVDPPPLVSERVPVIASVHPVVAQVPESKSFTTTAVTLKGQVSGLDGVAVNETPPLLLTVPLMVPPVVPPPAYHVPLSALPVWKKVTPAGKMRPVEFENVVPVHVPVRLGTVCDVGAVGEELSPPMPVPQELVTAPTASSATTNTPDHHRAITFMLVTEEA